MAEVSATTHIRAPLADVYRVAKDVERFPEFMPDVESIRVLERAGSRTVTEWVGLVQGRKIRWVEEDHWDDAAHLCTFRQREGDFTTYEGTWGFEAVPEGTRTTLNLVYEMDLPLAGALLSNLLKVLVRKNLESMLAALKGQLEGVRPAHP
ncbi:MAG TPA: SRPBCC family protein [bacterium]|nr:SRPBCC family protein [bacterium]